MSTYNSFEDFAKSKDSRKFGRKRNRIQYKPVYVQGQKLDNRVSIETKIQMLKDELGPIEIQQDFVIVFGVKTLIKQNEKALYESTEFEIKTETILKKR